MSNFVVPLIDVDIASLPTQPKFLETPLSREQLDELTTIIDKLEDTIEREKVELKKMVKEIKLRIEELTNERQNHRQDRKEGKRSKTVYAIKLKDVERGELVYVYEDKIIERTVMSSQDRQQSIEDDLENQTRYLWYVKCLSVKSTLDKIEKTINRVPEFADFADFEKKYGGMCDRDELEIVMEVLTDDRVANQPEQDEPTTEDVLRIESPKLPSPDNSTSEESTEPSSENESIKDDVIEDAEVDEEDSDDDRPVDTEGYYNHKDDNDE